MNKEQKARRWFDNNFYRGKDVIVKKIIEIMGEEK